MKQRRLALLLILLCFVGSACVVSAQTRERATETTGTVAADWPTRLDAIAEQLDKPDVKDAAFAQTRDQLEAIRNEARRFVTEQTPLLEEIQTEIEALGPAPGEGEEPETEAVAAQRTELKSRLSEIAGPIKEAELALGRVNRLISRLGEIRRALFAERLLERGPSPLSADVWRRALPELSSIWNSIYRSASAAVASPRFQENLNQSLYVLIAALVFAALLVWPAHRWLLRRYGRDPSVARPDFMRALRATVAVGVTRALLPTLAAGLIYAAALSGELLTENGAEIAQAFFFGIVLFTWTMAIFRASLAPTQPDWRIVPVPTKFARGVRGIVIGLALVFAVDIVLSEVIVTYSARLAVTALRDFALALLVAAMLLVLLLRQEMWRPAAEADSAPRWRLLRLLLAVGLFGVLIAGAFGYVALARYAVTQLVLTGGLVLLILILHRLGREFMTHALSPDY
jgi:small-conductance mechanosensitive channel